jgi:hypothetical protein
MSTLLGDPGSRHQESQSWQDASRTSKGSPGSSRSEVPRQRLPDDDSAPAQPPVEATSWRDRRPALVLLILAMLLGVGMLVAGAMLLVDAASVSSEANQVADERSSIEAETATVRDQVAAAKSEVAQVQADSDGVSAEAAALAEAAAAVVAAADELLMASDAATMAQNDMMDVEATSTERWNAGDIAGARDLARKDGRQSTESYRELIGEFTNAIKEFRRSIAAFEEALS